MVLQSWVSVLPVRPLAVLLIRSLLNVLYDKDSFLFGSPNDVHVKTMMSRLTKGEMTRFKRNLKTWEKRMAHRLAQRATRQRAAATIKLASSRRASSRRAEYRRAPSQRVATRQRAPSQRC